MSDELMNYIVSGGENTELEWESWTEQSAMDMAEKDQLTLTQAHLEVIHFLRELYKREGKFNNARVVLQALEKQFESQGGRKYLYGLFQQGPVSQACRYAGITVPLNSKDPSFGTSL